MATEPTTWLPSWVVKLFPEGISDAPYRGLTVNGVWSRRPPQKQEVLMADDAVLEIFKNIQATLAEHGKMLAIIQQDIRMLRGALHALVVEAALRC
jgi:hypothetical protein